MTIGMDCPHCETPDLEFEVVIEHGGERAVLSLPEYSSPGSGAEWYVKDDVECDVCKTVFPAGEMNDNEKLSDLVQRRVAEPPDPPDFDDYDDLD